MLQSVVAWSKKLDGSTLPIDQPTEDETRLSLAYHVTQVQ
jgi:hypothetical protein